MRFLLDSNVIIGLYRHEPGILANTRRHPPQDIGIPSVAMHELFSGAYKSRKQAENLARLTEAQFAVIDFDGEDARQAAEIRAVLTRAGTPIGPYDLLIAGQARARDLVLVTHNIREFARVPGLRIEDWQAGTTTP